MGPLHHPAFFRPDLGDWRRLHLGFGDELPVDRQRRRDAANSDEARQIYARLWCLPGCRRPTGEKALNSFKLDDEDYDIFIIILVITQMLDQVLLVTGGSSSTTEVSLSIGKQ